MCMEMRPVAVNAYDLRYASDLCLYGSAPVPFPAPDAQDSGAFLVTFDEPVLSLDDETHRHAVVIVARHPSFGVVVGAWASDPNGMPLTNGIEAWEPMEYPRTVDDFGLRGNAEIAETYVRERVIGE